jgi:integration host factor subunit alpha|tara:strand:+ start:1291 stop:1587 length:297 start_codon:yes stop_codon:yes gene_type:complete
MLKKNINRETLANIIYRNIGFSKVISENIVNDIFNILVSAFKENEKVKVTSFGTFLKKKKNKRIGRNPKTKEKKIISARNVITFKASKIFMNKINPKS